MKVLAKGVDLSVFNGNVDFAALAKAGIQFVIIRSGFGSDYPGQQDAQFESNVQKALAAGMPWGVYHYSYAKTAEAGRKEAEHCLRLLKGRKPPYGVWYDMEDSSTIGGDLAGAADAFCTTMQRSGLYSGVYANVSWFNKYLTSPVFDKFDRWVAQYNSVCQLAKPYGIWQYTDKLKIGGKNFDANYAYKDYPAMTGKTEEDEMLSYEQFMEYMERYDREQSQKPLPKWAKKEFAEAMSEGITDGTRPEQRIPRYQAALMALRALKRARGK